MNIRIIAFTDHGKSLADSLSESLGASSTRCGCGMTLDEWVRDAFAGADALIFIGAAGICVRSIAPYIKSKTNDPAVVVLDETGKYVIPILSGHLGGANDLARRIARLIGAEPVITTATDRKNVFSVDAWARVQGCIVENPERIKVLSAKILTGNDIVIASDYPISGEIPDHVVIKKSRPDTGKSRESSDIDAALTVYRNYYLPDSKKILYIVPRIVCAGVGCRKEIAAANVERALREAFDEAGIFPRSLCGMFSIDLKKNEKGLLDYCTGRKIPFVTFTAGQLSELQGGFSSSDFVKEITGVDNVCERSALLGAALTQNAETGRLILRKHVYDGVTVALAVRDFRPDFRWTEE